jgi:protein required for attachment to host cells
MFSNKHLTWVVITDSSCCRIYHYHKKPEQLVLINEINHPENRLKDTDLTSDTLGRYQTGESAHGAYAPHSDPKEVKIDDFAREISKELEKSRNINAYNNLVVISPPHMDGLLLKHLDKHVRELVTHNINKDAIHLAEDELLDFLHTHIQ